MNKEIKFRAWVDDDHTDTPYMAVQGTPDLETLQSFMFHYGSQERLMQYTGLKDKNGKEIYEGDVVKSEYGWIGEVKAVAGAPGWIVSKIPGDCYPEYLYGHITWEVIGNIYARSNEKS